MWRDGRRIAAALAATLAVVGYVGTASAHELSRSTSRVVAERETVRATLTLAALELRVEPPVDRDGDGVASVDEVDAAIPTLFAAIRQHFHVDADGGAPVSLVLDRYGVSDGVTLRLELLATFPAPVQTVTITSTLHTLTAPDHRHLTHVRIGGASHEAVLDASRTTATVDGGRPRTWDTLRQFVILGLEHLLTGYDHLAFIVVLLVGATTLFEVATIATAFTAGHSVTLGLATFGLVSLPPVLVEIAIALSIAWVAAENLLRDRVEHRWRFTFAFGLVHGFGFSNVLRDMALAPGALAVSLFGFNAGVELGQLAVVALTFPLVSLATRRQWRSPMLLAGSSTVLCLGVYWLVERWLAA